MSENCVEQKLKLHEIPDFLCKDGSKHFLSKEQKKDYKFGGPLPVICPMKRGNCPDMTNISDTQKAKEFCKTNDQCHFIGHALLDKNGPNHCIPKSRSGCITLTEDDLVRDDKDLTDDPTVCNRLGVGGIFDRGNGDGNYTRKGDPTCLRGCFGSKYWKNPKFMWGGGGTSRHPFKGSWDNTELELGPLYLEAAPSDDKPGGWGGPKESPWHGNGILPLGLAIPYTESRGEHSPPCNITSGDVGIFTTEDTKETLAGPGCRLTPPRPRYGVHEWSYTCECPYLGQLGEVRSDAWKPCKSWELNENVRSNRDVCKGCRIQDSKTNSLYGHCVLGEETPDTESEILGCVPDPNFPEKCRVNRVVKPIECPSFCSNDVGNPMGWNSETQCSSWIKNECWVPNPGYTKVISKSSRDKGEQSAPYIFNKNGCETVETDYLCRNCSQTPLESNGSGTNHPNTSHCVVGGSSGSDQIAHGEYGKYLSRNISCPPTCKSCMSGVSGEPLEAVYNLDESNQMYSLFKTDILYVPWVGSQSTSELDISKKESFRNRINLISDKL
jgi:hypothetical protein